MNILGAIIAGGKSKRMGSEKSFANYFTTFHKLN